MALGAIGPDARESVAGLKHRIAFEDIRTRVEIADALFRIKPDEAEPIEICIKAIKNPDREEVWIRACQVLEMMGANAAKATPDLIIALKNKDVGVRVRAAEVLGSIGPAAKEAMPLLNVLLKDEHEKARKAAQEALERIRKDDAGK